MPRVWPALFAVTSAGLFMASLFGLPRLSWPSLPLFLAPVILLLAQRRCYVALGFTSFSLGCWVRVPGVFFLDVPNGTKATATVLWVNLAIAAILMTRAVLARGIGH